MSARCGVGHVVCSNVMRNMQWWCDVEWGDVKGGDVKSFGWCNGMMCHVKTLNVVWSWVVWNAIRTLLITHTTALVECGRTHTHKTNSTQLHAHRQSSESRGEKVGLEGRIKWYYGRYKLVIRCDVEWYVVWCGMSVAWMDYRVWSGAEWCGEEERMVWLKWWCEIVVWCRMLWCDFVCGMDKVMFSAVCSFCIT